MGSCLRGTDKEKREVTMTRTSTARTPKASVLATFACTLLSGTSIAYAADVTFERLRNPEPQNWLMNHGDFGAQRFSALAAINTSNAKNLKLAFAAALGG